MRTALLCLLLSAASCAWAHIGSPNVFFEGKAGAYEIRVAIRLRPPGVVPGLAEINVRVLRGIADRVTALPVYWDAGREGAPPPDVAERVRGETNLFSTALWLMTPGAYSVDVTVEGNEGKGTVIVPVNSVATTRNDMRLWFSAILVSLGALLFFGAVKLAGAAFGESVLEPGVELTKKLRWRARLAMVVGTIAFSLLLLFGKAWWNLEDRDYRSNRLYKPAPVSASVRTERIQPIMRLTIDDAQARDWAPLIPDHGKLMHLFLVREDGLDVFAHLHPVQQQSRIFDVAIPPLPAGGYTIYADVTHENGLSQTLTASVQIPAFSDSFMRLWQPSGGSDVICSSTWLLNTRTNLFLLPDSDDSWHVERVGSHAVKTSQARAGQPVSRLADGYTMVWERNGTVIENREAFLRFKLISPNGKPVSLEPYMGMFGHAAIRRHDGAVFAHLHPVGTFSMASQQFFVHRENAGAPSASRSDHVDQNVTAPKFPTPTPHPAASRSAQVEDNVTAMQFSIDHAQHSGSGTNVVTAVSFPYEFPKPGPYRIWVQLKTRGKVFTGVFDADVQPEP